jgi:hypothetical protein
MTYRSYVTAMANMGDELGILRQPKPMRGGPLKLHLTELVRHRLGQGSALGCPLTKKFGRDCHGWKSVQVWGFLLTSCARQQLRRQCKSATVRFKQCIPAWTYRPAAALVSHHRSGRRPPFIPGLSTINPW